MPRHHTPGGKNGSDVPLLDRTFSLWCRQANTRRTGNAARARGGPGNRATNVYTLAGGLFRRKTPTIGSLTAGTRVRN